MRIRKKSGLSACEPLLAAAAVQRLPEGRCSLLETSQGDGSLALLSVNSVTCCPVLQASILCSSGLYDILQYAQVTQRKRLTASSRSAVEDFHSRRGAAVQRLMDMQT